MANKKIHTLGVRVEDEAYKILEFLAKKDDRTVSYVVRNLIDEWIEWKKLKRKHLNRENLQHKKTNNGME